jgi:hypothetical protein
MALETVALIKTGHIVVVLRGCCAEYVLDADAHRASAEGRPVMELDALVSALMADGVRLLSQAEVASSSPFGLWRRVIIAEAAKLTADGVRCRGCSDIRALERWRQSR